MFGSLLASLAACTAPPVSVEPAPSSGPTWANVAPDLVRCVGCHDHAGLVFPLTTYREAAPQAALIAAAVSDGRMPPWPAGPADVTYLDNPSLTAEQIARIVAWADAGAPLGDADPDAALVAAAVPGLPRVDAELTVDAPYAPLGDVHRCFVLDRTALTAPYITGVEVVPSNLAVSHHQLLTAVVPADPADSPATADAANPAPGFDCTVVTLADFHGSSVALGGWLPGRGPDVFPAGTGIALDPDAQIVLEAHYYAPVAAGADQATVRFMTADHVEAPAVEMRITHPAWSQHQGIAVPAGETATNKLETTVGHELGGALNPSGGIQGYWVLPHMHTLGVSIELDLIHDGVSTVLVDVPAWSYEWQLTYWFSAPVSMQPDDLLHLVCVMDNPTDQDVWWGESTEDEMCVARVFVAAP